MMFILWMLKMPPSTPQSLLEDPKLYGGDMYLFQKNLPPWLLTAKAAGGGRGEKWRGWLVYIVN